MERAVFDEGRPVDTASGGAALDGPTSRSHVIRALCAAFARGKRSSPLLHIYIYIYIHGTFDEKSVSDIGCQVTFSLSSLAFVRHIRHRRCGGDVRRFSRRAALSGVRHA